jgi:asparagine synthase (glutamine-hydrolysing)
MCGIAGLVRRDGLAPDDVRAVERMTAAQVHRGPDGVGRYLSRRAVLGHRRLSIIDVSEAGRQPMSNEDGSVWVTYNGEIYNHPELRCELQKFGHEFRSRTDTEVILHGYEQWGAEGLLDRLRGMFAFGLWDERRGLLLARDRLGIKPLYYHLNPSARVLLFASEVRAVLKSGCVTAERDPDALIGFLLGGSVPAPRTVVKGVRSLLPGHFLTWRLDGAAAIHKYWDLRQEVADWTSGTLNPVPPVRELLVDSVSRHLVSDVPLGVFLSGGVDSGAIVALASRARSSDGRALSESSPLHTLTVTFDEHEFSEAQPTRAIADRFHTDHHEVRVTRSEFIAELLNIFAAMDQPTNDGVNTYFVCKAARNAGLTVVLSGLGGDEVFWGYSHYRRLGILSACLKHCPPSVRRALARSATAWGALRGQDNWMRMGFLERPASDRALYLTMRGFFAPQHVMRLLGIGERELEEAVEREFENLPVALSNPSPEGFNYLECKRYLHDQLLRDTDVFGMAHSIEVRVPLLDHPLVEFARTVQPEQKTANSIGINKPLLVHAVDDLLVGRAGAAHKRGFTFPMDRWMKGTADTLEDMAASGNLLDRRAVSDLWKDFRASRLHWSRAWALTVLGATPH